MCVFFSGQPNRKLLKQRERFFCLFFESWDLADILRFLIIVMIDSDDVAFSVHTKSTIQLVHVRKHTHKERKKEKKKKEKFPRIGFSENIDSVDILEGFPLAHPKQMNLQDDHLLKVKVWGLSSPILGYAK